MRGRLRFLQAGHGLQASLGGFGPLGKEMRGEKAPVFLVLVKMQRRQHRREHRYPSRELHRHEAADYGVSNKIVAINAAINDQSDSLH